ncbi:hypothetical protein B484DRAFT_441655 [Ochromonadaceae sp. CCMP2298]|nr:hypothetical protein B484DRAFT_441655 [Ochromonadaceae sp. CCMP2298]
MDIGQIEAVHCAHNVVRTVYYVCTMKYILYALQMLYALHSSPSHISIPNPFHTSHINTSQHTHILTYSHTHIPIYHIPTFPHTHNNMYPHFHIPTIIYTRISTYPQLVVEGAGGCSVFTGTLQRGHSDSKYILNGDKVDATYHSIAYHITHHTYHTSYITHHIP